MEEALPVKAEELDGGRVKAGEVLPSLPLLQLGEGERLASLVGKGVLEAEGVEPPQLPLCVVDTRGERETDTVGACVSGKVGMAEGDGKGEMDTPLEPLLEKDGRGEREVAGEPDGLTLGRGLLL